MRIAALVFSLVTAFASHARADCKSPHPELSPQVCAPAVATEAELCHWAVRHADAGEADHCALERRSASLGVLELRADATRFLWLVALDEGLRPLALLGEVADPGLSHSFGRVELVRQLESERGGRQILAFETEEAVHDEDAERGARHAVLERHLTVCVRAPGEALACELRVPLGYEANATGDPEPTRAEAIAVIRHDGRLRLTLRDGDWRVLFGLGDLFGERLSVTLPLRAADAAREELDPDTLLVQLASR